MDSGRDESELNSALFVEYGYDLSDVTGEHGTLESLSAKLAKLSEECENPLGCTGAARGEASML